MHGWKVGGGLADCHRRRASQDAAVKERGVWGQRAGCGEAVAGLGRQGRGRLWLCLGGAVEGAFCSAWMRLKAAIFAMLLTPCCLDMGSWWACTCLVKVVAWTKLQYDIQ